ncbi:MAG: Phosphatidate cytidylyltransferase [Pseudomonadota bacterium]|jgi:phosphatidate cytidylyltransferase
MGQQLPENAARFNSEWITRPLFGIFMVIVATAVLLYSSEWFACLTVLVALFAAREWHRLVRSPAQRAQAEQRPVHLQTMVTAAAIALSVLALLEGMIPAALAVLGVGAAVSFIFARRRNDNPLWHAGGVLYLGVPVLALVALRALPLQGALIVLGMFLIVWATDTGALVFGKLIGGPRIAPKLSPGKTWAGTIGGSLCAALMFAIYIAVLGFDVSLAALYAFVFSFVAHGGDLFESLVKRCFGTKDSGSMIPGHGGVLDRMDSTFAASVVLALLVFGAGFNPMFGGQS